MRLRSILSYIVRAVVLGLAIAFVLTIVWPDLLHLKTNSVEIRQALPTTVSRPDFGPVSYAAAVENSAPAVVNINTAKVVSVRRHSFLNGPLFERFFGRSLDDLITPQQRVETSLGSGVIMSDSGYILTNHHLIEGADEIQVSLRDGRTASASVIGKDPETDLAVLKLDLENLPAITVGQSEGLRIGDVVLAIGNPFGFGQTVTMGIVSATGRTKLGINTFENFIQTDAAINPGNSGGALIDANGNLVGINTAIYSRSGGSQGIGFAIPVSLAQNVLQDIIEHGRALRGWLGIEARAITPELARSLGLLDTRGVLVVGILRDGPAHQAGLQPGDVILTIDDKTIAEAADALLAISSRKPGSRIKLHITRNDIELDLEAVAIERPPRTRLR
ncbi:MAG: trypsin-like peptidase domain-containing protein [Gammaproteobacteria bacterium]|nr:trypsin-like peptidase domain-containing protein [Gammaproteobacteria bacterium]